MSAAEIDDYLAAVSGDKKAALLELRKTIRKFGFGDPTEVELADFDPGNQWYRNLGVVGGPQRLIDSVVKWANQALPTGPSRRTPAPAAASMIAADSPRCRLR